MKMVLEEIEGKIARLVPDDTRLHPHYVSVEKLPENTVIGDVFEVEVELPSFTLVKMKKIENEREKRLADMKRKRENLLNGNN